MKYKILLAVLILVSIKSFAQGKWYGMGIPYNDGIASALCPDTVNNILYAGGEFELNGSPNIHYLIKWNGSIWDTSFYISPSQGYVDALIMYNGKLYMGLNNGDTLGAVLSYDGTTSAILATFNGPIYCLAVYDDTLFAGGAFGSDNLSDQVFNIAKWNGSNWLSVDSGVYSYYVCCPEVNAMTVYNNQLIAAGYFDHAGGKLSYSIAGYNGTIWQPLQLGIGDTTPGNSGIVQALEVYSNKLYVGGFVTIIDASIPTHGLGVWDGSHWNSAASNLNGEAFALKSFDDYLFIGGDAGYASQFIYKFDGVNLNTVDSGAGPDVLAFNSWGHSLYVGGSFDTVGKTVFAQGIARWTPDEYSGLNQLPSSTNQLSIYPNPASNQLTINSKQLSIDEVTISNVLGQVVYKSPVGDLGVNKQTIDVHDLLNGIYVLSVKINGANNISKLVISR